MFLFLSFVLLAVVVTVAARGGGTGAPERQVLAPQEPDAASRTSALLAGIPQHGPVLGYRKAPVRLQFFGDLQCTSSRRVMTGALPILIRRYVRTGKLQIQFRSKETDTRSAGGWFEFREQQVAAMAAGKQSKLWHFVSVFYRNQGPEFSGYAGEPFLEQTAKEAGLNIDSWKESRTPPENWVPRIEADEALADALRLRTTPTFAIGPTGGFAWPIRHFSLEEPGAFEEAIRGVLKNPGVGTA